MADDARKKLQFLKGLLENNEAQGGLLSSLTQNPNLILGASILGQGIKGQDPFSSIIPALTQTGKIQKLFTPKIPKTKPVLDSRTQKPIFASDKRIATTNLEGDVLVPIPAKGQTTNIINQAENAFNKDMGKGDAATVLNLRKESLSALKENDSLTLVNTLAKNLETGQFGNSLLDLAKLGQRFNIDMNFLSNFSDSGSIDGTIANAETLKIVSSVFVFDAIGKTKGSISEKEMQLFNDISLGLGTTPEGIALTSKIKRGINNRIMEKSTMMEEWVSDGKSRPTTKKDTIYGKLTFNQMYEKYINEEKNGKLVNPLFTEEEYAEMSNIASANTNPNIITDKQGNRYYRTPVNSETGISGYIALPKLK